MNRGGCPTGTHNKRDSGKQLCFLSAEMVDFGKSRTQGGLEVISRNLNTESVFPARLVSVREPRFIEAHVNTIRTAIACDPSAN